MNVKNFFIFIMTFASTQIFAEDQNDCFRKMIQVVDQFIEPQRTEIGVCEQSSDCVWMAVGSGLHLNKKFYSRWARCYNYASARSEAFCRDSKSTRETMGLSGLGMAYRNPEHPIAYTCLKKQCTPIFDKEDISFKEKDKTLWKKYFPTQNDDLYLKDGELCKDEFDKNHLPQLSNKTK